MGGRTHRRAGAVLAGAAALIVTAGCADTGDQSEDPGRSEVDVASEDGSDAAAGSPGADVSTADPSGEQQCSLVDAEAVSKATGLDLLLSVSTSGVREDNCWWSEPGTTSTAEQDAVTLIVEHWAMADLAACLELLARGETVPNARVSGLVHVAKMPADDGLFAVTSSAARWPSTPQVPRSLTRSTRSCWPLRPGRSLRSHGLVTPPVRSLTRPGP